MVLEVLRSNGVEIYFTIITETSPLLSNLQTACPIFHFSEVEFALSMSLSRNFLERRRDFFSSSLPACGNNRF